MLVILGCLCFGGLWCLVWWFVFAAVIWFCGFVDCVACIWFGLCARGFVFIVLLMLVWF